MTISEVTAFTASYIGSQYGFDESPPRSAKLVADISWGWSPAHDRLERYLLCTDRKRTGWTLWAKAYDECSGKLMYSRLALGTPYRGILPRDAAEQLLKAAWAGEKKGYLSDLRGAHVDNEGLLTKHDIKRIEDDVFADLYPTPETLVTWESYDQEWRCHFRGTLKEACTKYGIELGKALKELNRGSVPGPGDVVLRKAER